MLLETLEEGNESVIVFSRNILSNDNNFRMLLKNDPEKKPKKLFLYDICGVINHPVPKNLVVYRLLTNIEELAVIDSNYGCFIETGEGRELIYPDPVYAIKELEEFTEENYLPNLKFRIQQVGFFTNYIEKDSIKFKEAFSFDLDSIEAKAQNDTVFVQAMLKNAEDSASEEKDFLYKELYDEIHSTEELESDYPAVESEENDLTFRSIIQPGMQPPEKVAPQKISTPVIYKYI
jgi:hypothetical protein